MLVVPRTSRPTPSEATIQRFAEWLRARSRASSTATTPPSCARWTTTTTRSSRGADTASASRAAATSKRASGRWQRGSHRSIRPDPWPGPWTPGSRSCVPWGAAPATWRSRRCARGSGAQRPHRRPSKRPRTRLGTWRPAGDRCRSSHRRRFSMRRRGRLRWTPRSTPSVAPTAAPARIWRHGCSRWRGRLSRDRGRRASSPCARSAAWVSTAPTISPGSCRPGTSRRPSGPRRPGGSPDCTRPGSRASPTPSPRLPPIIPTGSPETRSACSTLPSRR
jgi:hypothetical protein